MQLNLLPGLYAVCQLESTFAIPEWARRSGFLAFTVDDREATVVCRQDCVPDDVTVEKNWRCFQVDGILDFSLTGIISNLTSFLAVEEISVYVVSTFTSDYLLVGKRNVDRAVIAWRENGHVVHQTD